MSQELLAYEQPPNYDQATDPNLHIPIRIMNGPYFNQNERPRCLACGSTRVYGAPSYQCMDCGWLDLVRYERLLLIRHEQNAGPGDWEQSKRSRGVGDWR